MLACLSGLTISRGLIHRSSITAGGLAIAGLLLAPSPASAHEEDDPDGDFTRAYEPDYDPNRYRSPRYGAFEFRIGPYSAHIDDEFDTATPYADAYGSKGALAIGVEFDWQPLRISHLGSLGLGVAWHWTQKGGTAPYAGDPAPGNPEESAHKQKLWIMPMYTVAVFRLDVFAKEYHVPIVPYAKGGFAFAFWQARDASSLSEYNGIKGKGLETGLQFQLGAMLHLNPLSAQGTIDMDNSTGVNDAYLYIEWWKSSVDSFGKGMQVGTSTWMTGLALEF